MKPAAAHVEVGRLAGDGEVRLEAGGDELVGRAVLDLLGLLVGHAHEAHAHPILVAQVVQRAHHRGQAALHVVGAAALEPVALHARHELLRPCRHDVVVAVEDQRRPLPRTDLGGQRKALVELVVGDGDLARLQPALDEARRGAQAFDVRRVIGDEALGEDPLIHPQEGSLRAVPAALGRLS